MPTFTVPMPIPFPFPRPGVGTPFPFPVPNPGIPTPSPMIPFPTMPAPDTKPPGSFWGPFADLFKFDLDWRYFWALIVIVLSVMWVEEVMPQYVWQYVAIILLGVLYL